DLVLETVLGTRRAARGVGPRREGDLLAYRIPHVAVFRAEQLHSGDLGHQIETACGERVRLAVALGEQVQRIDPRDVLLRKPARRWKLALELHVAARQLV